MEHQPFETWILSPDRLDLQQAQVLQAHLLVCADCRRLQAGWQAARAELHAAPLAAPQPGFGQRFQSSLAARKLQQQMQVRRTLLFLIVGAVTLTLVMATTLIFNTSAADVLTAVLSAGLTLITSLHALQGILLTWINLIPAPVAVLVWIPLSVGFVILVAGWAFSLWRVTTQGVINQ